MSYGGSVILPARKVRRPNPTTGTAEVVTPAGAGDAYTTAQADTLLAAKAPLASPALTGTPTAPTAAYSTNTTQLATTAFVQSALTALINGAPAAFDTLMEIYTQMQADESAVSSLITTVSGKASLTGATFTGAVLFNAGLSVIGGTSSLSAASMTTLAASGNATIGGTLGVTGTTTVAALTASGTILTTAEAHFGLNGYTDSWSGQSYDAKFGGAGNGIAVKGASVFGGTLGVTGQINGSTISTTGTITAASQFISTRGNIATTSSDGLALTNGTAATSGATVQYSTRVRHQGTAWNTSTLASQTIEAWAELIPSSGNPISGIYRIQMSVNGAAATTPFQITNGGTLTLSGNMSAGSGSFSNGVTCSASGITSLRNNIATTSTDGLVVGNTQAATSAVPVQWSPRARQSGTAWTGAASNTVNWATENRPTAGITPGSVYAWMFDRNGGGYTDKLTLTDAGNLAAAGTISAPTLSAGAGGITSSAGVSGTTGTFSGAVSGTTGTFTTSTVVGTATSAHSYLGAARILTARATSGTTTAFIVSSPNDSGVAIYANDDGSFVLGPFSGNIASEVGSIGGGTGTVNLYGTKFTWQGATYGNVRRVGTIHIRDGTVGHTGTPDLVQHQDENGNLLSSVDYYGGRNGPVNKAAFFQGGISSSYTHTSNGFNTVPIVKTTDNGSNFNDTTHFYTVPKAGTYQIVTKFRIADAVTSGQSYGVGAHVSNTDGSWFAWFVTAPNRNGAINTRIVHLAAGDQIRMYAYTDGFSPSIQSAEMNIVCLTTD